MDGTLSLAGCDNSRTAELPGAALVASLGTGRGGGAAPGWIPTMARHAIFETRAVSPTRTVPGAGGGKGPRGRAGTGDVPALVRSPRSVPASVRARAERPLLRPAARSL